MQKILSLYMRDPDTNLKYVSREVNPKAAWVLAEPTHTRATVKWDGTCTLLDAHGQWWSRHQLRPGKTAPGIYHPVETDPITGKTQGWIPAEMGSFKRQLADALTNAEEEGEHLTPGTYELIGEKVQSNPHGLPYVTLVRHGDATLVDVPTDYDVLAEWLRMMNRTGYLEGVVWHHDDGRMAKIKTRDFPPLMETLL